MICGTTKAAILVVGMHRSGTSALARVLSLLGCDLPKTLLDANPSNKAGHWESLPIMTLNEEILTSTGSAWNDWGEFNPQWFVSSTADRFRERIQDRLHEEFTDSRLFVLKDPRICRLLPLWIEAVRKFGAEPLVVSPLRNPLDVAASLEVRDGIDPSVGLLIWLRHVLDTEAASRGLKRAYLRYEHLLLEPDVIAERLGDALGIRWPRSSAETRMEVKKFLSPELRHHGNEDTLVLSDPKVSHWIRSTFEILDGWANGRTRKTDTSVLTRTKAAFDKATPAFARAVASGCDASRELGLAREELAERDQRLRELTHTVREHDERLEELARAVATRDERIRQILASHSWRLMSPFRTFKTFLIRIRRHTTHWRRPPAHSTGLTRLRDVVIRSILARRLAECTFAVLHRYPILIPAARLGARLLPRWVTVQLRRYHQKWLMVGPASPSRQKLLPDLPSMHSGKTKPKDLERLRPFAMAGQLTKGWYGGRELKPDETFLAQAQAPPHILKLGNKAYQEGSNEIRSRFLPNSCSEDSIPPYLRFGPVDELRAFLAACRAPETIAEMSDCGGFSIVTPFHRHLELFREASTSVDRVAQKEQTIQTNFEWIIVNDDPKVSNEELARQIPQTLTAFIRIMRPGRPGGIVNTLNTGIRNSRNRWILFLDCDDEIEPHAIACLKHYIRQFPRNRYISSSMIDIDDAGNVLRFRGNEQPPERLADVGMFAGHLKAVRRDLFEDIGYLDPRFELSQDYEFALRTAMIEPILKIPEPLYRYRWHGKTQSVSRAERQRQIGSRVRREYMHRVLTARKKIEATTAAVNARHHAPSNTMPRGAVIVRTQNKRPELLLEAVESIRAQAPHLTPIIVVHGGADDMKSVESQLSCNDETAFLYARKEDNRDRERGYPANVALDYVCSRAHQFDYVSFLDDDDILYPYFAVRMGEALRLSGADLVYAMANKRWLHRLPEPGPAPLPASCLVAENFIPINSFSVTTPFLLRTQCRFDEHIYYLEDWDFILSLWDSGAQFFFLDEVVSEFRITNDGNISKKKNPALYSGNLAEVRRKIQDTLRHSEEGLARFQRDLAIFNWPDMDPLSGSRSLEVINLAHKIWIETKHNAGDYDESQK